MQTDGTVWAFGSNQHGQLGDGTTTTRSTAVQVSGLTNIVRIAAGRVHSMAIAASPPGRVAFLTTKVFSTAKLWWDAGTYGVALAQCGVGQ